MICKKYALTTEEWKYCLGKTPYQFISDVKNIIRDGRCHSKILEKLLYNFVFIEINTFYSQSYADNSYALYLARIYYKEEDHELNKSKNSPFQGYNIKDSFVPPKHLTKEGRVNKKGIVYLYTANKEDTAIKEICPNIDNLVSIAKIRPKENLHFINFALSSSGIEIGTPLQNNWVNSLILNLANCFCSVNTKKDDYQICQYIGNFAKKIGFDGISYYSSKNKSNLKENAGINIAIFNFDKCEVISSKVKYISDITISHFDITI